MSTFFKATLAVVTATTLLAAPATALTVQPAVTSASPSNVLQAQFLGKGNTPEQEVRRIFKRHLYLGSFIGRSVRQAAGANAVLSDDRVQGQYGVCTFVSYRGGRAIVCYRT